MRIISWNVRYDCNEEKYFHVMHLNPDILILQECEKNSYDELKKNWKYKNWYNDDLNNESSNLGVAIFSNDFPIEMCDKFNRNYRYVIPYKIKFSTEFTLFAVWTKNGPQFEYSQNVLRALDDAMYSEYFAQSAMLVGDFNFATTKENNHFYEQVKPKSLINKIASDAEYQPTYFHQANGAYYTNDYCLITKEMDNKFSIKIAVLNFDKEIANNNKYEGLSDHCPVVVEVQAK